MQKFILRFKNLFFPASSQNKSLPFQDYTLENLRNWQWESLEKNLERQKIKLLKTLLYSIDNIPYYQKVAKKIKFKPSKETIFEDIKNWPVLTKDIIRKNFNGLYNPKYIDQSVLNSSGGTTGEPIKLYQQGININSIGELVKLQNEWAGLKEKDLLVQLWGNEEELFQYGDAAKGIIKISEKHYILNTFRMSSESMERYRKFINRKKPKIILAYVQSAVEFANFIKKRKLFLYSPHSIMTSAGTLHDSHKKLISSVYKCPVFNRYGSREVHAMACSCEKDEGLHIDTFFHYLEILDEKLNPITNEGKIGEVYITLFNNPVMPLLRYKIGDLATYTKQLCSCGRGLPLIKKINGRTVDIFVNSKGEKIDGEYFTHLFYLKDFIKQFQVIQKDKNLIQVKLVPNGKNILEKHKTVINEIREKIKLIMGKDCLVRLETVSQIDLPRSGKFRYTISELNK